jgi:mRNA-degrading endonuclease HigB of HigAB toxin-antitoxin module
MRLITLNTLVSFIEQYPRCEQALKSWLYEIKIAEWSTP